MGDGPIQSQPASADNAETGTNANVVVTLAATAGIYHILPAILFSYSDTPTGGRLTVEDGAANIVMDLDITAKGAGRVPFVPALRSTVNTALIITLYAGGVGIVGKLNVPGPYTQG
jgi:hypothetical protein